MRQVLSFTVFVVLSLSCARNSLISPQALMFEGQCVESLEKSDFDTARIRCELCLEYDETVAECINGLGLVALADSKEELAKERFTRAIHMNANFAQARNNLGVVYFRRGDYHNALDFFIAAIQIDPGFEDARYNAGLSHKKIAESLIAAGKANEAQEQLIRASDQFKKVIAINPNFSNAIMELGEIELKKSHMNVNRRVQSQEQ